MRGATFGRRRAAIGNGGGAGVGRAGGTGRGGQQRGGQGLRGHAVHILCVAGPYVGMRARVHL